MKVGGIKVEIIAAWPHHSERRILELPMGTHVEDAIAATGFASSDEFVGVAVFGQRVTPRHVLADGDRVELLRGLNVDPKAARRARAEVQRAVERKERNSGR